MKGNKKAFLFGPFIGELYWEMYRFAPYAISLKKRFPKHHLIVFTRRERFDLYGQYANIFIPLKIGSRKFEAKKFTIKGFSISDYIDLCKYIKKRYMNLYNIVDHYTPRIDAFMYKVKWQFPRKYMDYDFKPRVKNRNIVNNIYKDLDNIVVTNDENIKLKNYNVVTREQFFKDVKKNYLENSSQLGCLIHLLKGCEFIISNFDDNLARLGVLCGKNVITVKENFTDDAIHLMNPLKSVVIKCDKFEEGVKEYEDKFRS